VCASGFEILTQAQDDDATVKDNNHPVTADKLPLKIAGKKKATP